jgi:hypothetical protein
LDLKKGRLGVHLASSALTEQVSRFENFYSLLTLRHNKLERFFRRKSLKVGACGVAVAQRGSAVVKNNNENVSGSLPGPGKYLRHAPVLCANIRLPRKIF